jgi:hypothetical protein
MRPWYLQLRAGTLALRETVLSSALLVAWLVVAPLSFWLHGVLGLAAASLAAVVCLTGAAAALAIGELSGALAGPLVGLLLAMGMRTGVPLLFVVVLQLTGGVLKGAGLVYYVVLFYVLALGVEVPLSLPPGSNHPGCPGTARNSV